MITSIFYIFFVFTQNTIDSRTNDINIDTCYVNVVANRMRDLWVEWKFTPGENAYSYDIPYPYFKYEMPFIFNIHDPYSETAEEVKAEIYDCYLLDNWGKRTYLKTIKFYELFGGDRVIKVDIPRDLSLINYKYLVVQVAAEKYVSADPFFYDFTYATFNTLDREMFFDITVSAHFAYGIRKYWVDCSQYDSVYNLARRIHDFDTLTIGEKIQIKLQKAIPKEAHVNIHLTASRLKIGYSRIDFWRSVFLIALLIIAAPLLLYLVHIVKSLKYFIELIIGYILLKRRKGRRKIKRITRKGRKSRKVSKDHKMNDKSMKRQ